MKLFAITRLSQGVPVFGNPHKALPVLRACIELRDFQASIRLIKAISTAFSFVIFRHPEKTHPLSDSFIDLNQLWFQLTHGHSRRTHRMSQLGQKLT
jgi:hypothetical protein